MSTTALKPATPRNTLATPRGHSAHVSTPRNMMPTPRQPTPRVPTPRQQIPHTHDHDHEHGHSHVARAEDEFERVSVTRNIEFSVFYLYLMVGIVVLYATLTDYQFPTPAGFDYSRYQDVHVMVFIGMGFLMAYSANNSLTATAHPYLIACFVTLWYILVKGFFMSAIPGLPKTVDWKLIRIDYLSLVDADFAALAVIVSFGAALGRLSSSQLLLMAFLEVIFYTFNEVVIKTHLYGADVGAGFYVHIFASVFGVVVASLCNRGNHVKHEDPVATHESKILGFVGALFLYCFYPSFNSVHAVSTGIAADLAVVNTILSLATSTVISFWLITVFFGGKVCAGGFARAALVGGIAMGASANFNMHPFAAMIIGGVAAIASILSYLFLRPLATRFLGLHDTNSVLSTHFIPALVGGITSVIVTRVADAGSYHGAFPEVFPRVAGGNRDIKEQANAQLASLAISAAFALFGGLITGIILQLTPQLNAYHDDEIEFE